ncbi:uncharacterized protein LOC118205882 [Stegodyphus dumicola]|uniref:uncharacterized protein LOC118205882 n=1 Tax=Stegodyphus dumicola TaxID=202533 RepID=UPI0015AFE6AA|nr:uncharacterized protein LOC118205882 [Stegodyphus dumicola]
MAEFLEAIFNCDIKKLKNLFDNGYDINCTIPGTDGCTPLHIAVGIEIPQGKEQMLSYLLEMGADPNARSHDALTPVHIAAMWNNCQELELLLKRRGNPWLTDNENKNSFDLAIDNNAYEAYQLLNKYLSEDKLNFNTKKNSNNNAVPPHFNKSLRNEKVECKSKGPYFCTANDNFPLLLSSTEDDSDFAINVSKFLKRKTMVKLGSEGNKLGHKETEKIDSLENHTSDIRNKINTSLGSYGKLSEASCMEIENSDTSVINDFEASLVEIENSDTSVINYFSENDSSETIIPSDCESDIVLVEKYVDISSLRDSIKNADVSTCSMASDWKACQTSSSKILSQSNCLSHSTSAFQIAPELEKYSNSKIFQELKILGDDPGPVLDHTRQVYLRRLTMLKSGCKEKCNLPKPKYCPEMYFFMEGTLDIIRIQNMENILAQEFDDSHSEKKWREGNQRCCFNYFLLDPRVTQNLPNRSLHLPPEKSFLIFIDSLFYVGKGTRGRPYSHLFEAAKAMTNPSLVRKNKVLIAI